MELRVWIVLLAAAALLSCGRRPQRAEESLLFRGVLVGQIVKVELESGSRRVVLEEPEEINALLSSGSLVKKPPCRCAHHSRVMFHTTEGEETASICEHCFDILKDGEIQRYSMPPGFYALFQKHMVAPQAPGAEQ